MTLQTIQEQWLGFAEMIFRNTPVGDTQFKETQKAFFAGWHACLTSLQEIGQEHVSVGEGVAYLESRKQECEQFYRDMMRDYAEGN